VKTERRGCGCLERKKTEKTVLVGGKNRKRCAKDGARHGAKSRSIKTPKKEEKKAEVGGEKRSRKKKKKPAHTPVLRDLLAETEEERQQFQEEDEREGRGT